MAVEEYFPFDSGAGSVVSEAGWNRMARLWAPPHVVGAPGSGAYNLTVSGLTATITRRPSAVAAEAWVDGFMHRLVDADKAFSVPVNGTTNPRVDRIVLRRDMVANTIALTLLQGTPAASPVAAALTQVDGGVYDLPLWRFTVPANSGTPLTGLVDDRVWRNPAGDTTGTLVAYGSQASGQAANTTMARVIGGLNVNPTLIPGRAYEVTLTGRGSSSTASSVSFTIDLRALAGSTSPGVATGTSLGVGGGFANISDSGSIVARGIFTVSTSSAYAISPFVMASSGSAGVALSAGTIVSVKDLGSVVNLVGSTPIAVP